MNDASDSDAGEQGGVFGNLPASRPGTRSPRRDRGAKAAKATKPATPGQKATPAPKRKPASPPPSRPDPPEPEPRSEQRGGLDDLAWAGVAAVAEAATLGVRLANRALGALRDGVDRR